MNRRLERHTNAGRPQRAGFDPAIPHIGTAAIFAAVLIEDIARVDVEVSVAAEGPAEVHRMGQALTEITRPAAGCIYSLETIARAPVGIPLQTEIFVRNEPAQVREVFRTT